MHSRNIAFDVDGFIGDDEKERKKEKERESLIELGGTCEKRVLGR